MKAINLEDQKIYPSKIICIGRNYVEHIKELNNEMPAEPVIFIKPNSAISNQLQSHPDEPLHYEGEITFLIENGKTSAVGFGLDLTKRQTQSDLKAKGLPWERAKAFDNSAVFSDFVRFDGDLSQLRMELFINDKLVQHADFDLMIYKPEVLLKEIQSFLTLEDGDLIMSGTPKGVGSFKAGDVFIGKIYNADQQIIQTSWTAD